jgi:hypothetical protein
MIKLVQLLKSFVVILPLTFIFLGCDESETYHPQSNYFPLNDQSEWEYQWEYGCDCPEKYLPHGDPRVLKVKGDTVINGKTYATIEDEYGPIKIVRQQGEKYFKVNLGDGTESLFLDANMPVGRSFSVSKHKFWEYKLTLQKRIHEMIVNDVTYHNILVVEDQLLYDDDQYNYTQSTFHYYADGIGEILTYNPPMPNSYMPFGSKFSLLRFK